MSDKCTAELPKVRVPDGLYLDLSKLAAAEDRTLSDYIRTVLVAHVYGHARKVSEVGDGH